MDTEAFLRKVLPSAGLKILARLVPRPDDGKPGWGYQSFDSFEAMAAAVKAVDARGFTVYHACNSFGDWYEENGKRRIRTQKNVVSCRALYDDIDVGKADGYATKQEALEHLRGFARATHLPAPLIVESGGGIHLYWPLVQDVDVATWYRLAQLKRRAAEAFGLKTDRSCDLDSARVLRPVGSTWRKNGEKPVKVVLDAGPYTVEQIQRPLEDFLAKSGVGTFGLEGRPSFAGLEVSNDFQAREYPPVSLEAVANHCAQVRAMRDTQGDVGYDHWRGVIGLAKYSTEGYPIVELWSERRAETGHAQTDTWNKFDTWTTPPPTCEFFRSCNPAGCTGCPHQVKSPIALGFTAEAEAPKLEVAPQEPAPAAAAEDSADPEQATAPVAPAALEPQHWPDGYRVINGELAAFVKGETEDDPGGWRGFARPVFWPLERVRQEDGTYAMNCCAQIKSGQQPRKFAIPTKCLSDSRSLKAELAKYEITVSNDKLVVKFMHDYLDNLRKNVDERSEFGQFGWNDDYSGFLIGNKLITADDVLTVQIGNSLSRADGLAKAFNLHGTPEEWVEKVNTLYNQPNGEPYQYIFCTVFGSVLAPILGLDEWSGIPLAVTSQDSGRGKTTAAKVAINALCDARSIMVTDTTPLAILKRASNLKNLCGLFDEVTSENLVQVKGSRSPGLSEILYSLSNGKGRNRLGSDGSERRPDPPWCLMSILTGNRNVISNLTESKLNPEAAQMRVFEIDMEVYPPIPSMDPANPELHAQHQEIAVKLSTEVTAVLAVPYLRYVMKNRDSIQKMLRDTASTIIKRLGSPSAKERFYAYHVACSMVGGQIAAKLGYLKFDMKAVARWALQHIKRLRREAQRHNVTVQDRFAAMLADLHGTLIVTKGFDVLDARAGKTEAPMKPEPRSPISGRLVLGGDAERGKLFITIRALDEWCRRNDVDASQFKRSLQQNGLIRTTSGDAGIKRIALAKGVAGLVMGASRCIEFEFAAAQGYVDEFVEKIPEAA